MTKLEGFESLKLVPTAEWSSEVPKEMASRCHLSSVFSDWHPDAFSTVPWGGTR